VCGFVGFIACESVGDQEQFFVSVVDRMMHAIAHRGFDGDGRFASKDARVFLGHKRLAIVNKHASGIQPMTTPDGRFTIIFNGEIYNYQLLMPEIIQQGYKINSGTDTEVLLLGFACWGIDFIQKLRGMFSFVVWDAVHKKAYLIKDQFGIKPLYFAQIQHNGVQGVLFASELKALIASGLIEKKINYAVLSAYVRYGFVKAPETIIKGVRSVEPATIVEFSDRQFHYKKFWTISSVRVQDRWKDFQECVSAVKEKFQQVVGQYSAAAVDLGVFLSAGIDSTLLLAMLTRVCNKKVSTFSLGFSSPFKGLTDESAIARQTAQKYGSNHYEIQVDGAYARSAFTQFIQAIDQPSGDGFNTFMISQLAGQHTPVVFSGIGGDELFLGYRYFNELLKRSRLYTLPGFNGFSWMAKYVADQFSFAKAVFSRFGVGFLAHGAVDGEDLYLAYRSVPNYLKLSELLSFDVRSKSIMNFSSKDLSLERIFAQEDDFLNAFSKAELDWYVPGVLLQDTDAVSMAWTIETRVPFLDIDFVELVLSMPSSYKKWVGQPFNKPLLVEGFKDFFPTDVLTGSKKGFEMPLGFWLKDNFKDRIQVLKDASWVDKSKVEALCQKVHVDPREYRDLWLLVVLANWAEHNGIEF